MSIIAVAVFLAISSITDIREKVIYLRVLIPFALIGILITASSGREAVISGAAGVIIGLLMLLLSFATKGAVGEGDGLVLMTTGIYLGFLGNLRLLCSGLFLSALFSLGAIVIRGWKRDRELPFMPFLLAGFFVVIIGDRFG